MKNLTYVLTIGLLLVACAKQDVVTPQKEPIPVNTNPEYIGNMGYVQGQILDYNFNITTGIDRWWSSSLLEIITRNNIRLPYLIPRSSITRAINDSNGDPSQIYSFNCNFEGLPYGESFDFLKKQYPKGKKMSFKKTDFYAQDGVALEFFDMSLKNGNMLGKSGSSIFGDQTGSTWEILDSQEVPLSQQARQAQMTNALAITSLINCKLYNNKGEVVGNVKNLKIQVVLNYKKI
ncbi:MAG: hypothetical protein ACOVQA_02885 [Thermoflexibacteraceae bacterium]